MQESRLARKKVAFWSARDAVGQLVSGALPGVSLQEEIVSSVLIASIRATSLFEASFARVGLLSRRSIARRLESLEESTLTFVGNAILRQQAELVLPPVFPVAVDCIDIAYHGEALSIPQETVRGQPKDGTTRKHRYITAYVPVDKARVTLVAFELYSDEKPIEGLRKVLDAIEAGGWLARISVLVADKGFYARETVRMLNERNVPFILPVPVKSKRIREWCAESITTWREFEIGGATGVEPVDLALVHVPDRGKKPAATFAYATRRIVATPHEVHELYLRRGGVETSYRQLNQVRARTSSRSRALRYLYFLVALILRNTWTLARSLLRKRRDALTPLPPTFRSFLYAIEPATTRHALTGRG